jgi:hypothetical protein
MTSSRPQIQRKVPEELSMYRGLLISCSSEAAATGDSDGAGFDACGIYSLETSTVYTLWPKCLWEYVIIG